MAKLSELMSIAPSLGGLNVKQYATPDGLRAYKNKDGSYGGQMMPKANGWLGRLPNKGQGGESTELSLEDDSGMFPAIVPTLNNEEISVLLGLKENQRIPENIYLKARKHADLMRSQGRSPFIEIWE